MKISLGPLIELPVKWLLILKVHHSIDGQVAQSKNFFQLYHFCSSVRRGQNEMGKEKSSMCIWRLRDTKISDRSEKSLEGRKEVFYLTFCV